MAEDNLKSLGWLDNLAALKTQLEKTPSANRASLAKALNLCETVVAYLSTLKPILDPAAIEKIRMAAKGDHPFNLSFKSAQILARLNGRAADLPGAVHDALDQILTRRLANRHIRALVNHIAKGKPAKDFDHTQIKIKREVFPSFPAAGMERLPNRPGQAPRAASPASPTLGQGCDKKVEEKDPSLTESLVGLLKFFFVIWVIGQIYQLFVAIYHHFFK